MMLLIFEQEGGLTPMRLLNVHTGEKFIDVRYRLEGASLDNEGEIKVF